MFDPESLISGTESGSYETDDQDVARVRRSSSWSLGSLLRPASPPAMLPALRGLNIRSLVESGRALTDKVQSLVMEKKPEETSLFNLPDTSEVDGQQNRLLESVSVAFERQENINRTNAQLSKLNYVVNVANFVKHKQVEMTIHEGQKHLSVMNRRMEEQENIIDGLNTSVNDLSFEVEHQRHISERLTSSLHNQQNLLEATIVESRRELEKQHSILARQQAVVDSLLQQKLRQDFLVDSGIVVLAVYVTNTILVDYPIRLLFAVVPKPKLRKWLQQFSKLVLIMQLVIIMKKVSVKCGIHTRNPFLLSELSYLASSGTCAVYIKQAAGFVWKQLKLMAVRNGLIRERRTFEKNRFLDVC